jgi:hypothetical protein
MDPIISAETSNAITEGLQTKFYVFVTRPLPEPRLYMQGLPQENEVLSKFDTLLLHIIALKLFTLTRSEI